MVGHCNNRFHRGPALAAGFLKASGGRYDAVCAFRPTGWAFGKGPQGGGAGGSGIGRTVRLGGNVTIVEVPYSEHSSFEELQACCRDLRPAKIVATVNGGPRGDRCPGMELLRADERGVPF